MCLGRAKGRKLPLFPLAVYGSWSRGNTVSLKREQSGTRLLLFFLCRGALATRTYKPGSDPPQGWCPEDAVDRGLCARDLGKG